MRILIQYPTLPVMKIDAGPEECARLLLLLGERLEGPLVASGESMREGARDRPVDAGVPAAKKAARSARPYRGRTNRRQMVLDAMGALAEEGRDAPALGEIAARVKALYPMENTQNLDQVVRDLANKTDLVIRGERGMFKLSNK